MPIPVYLKTSDDMPRPGDAEFYLVAQNGTFLCRNHTFFQSDVPAKRQPRGLAEHESSCLVRFPPVPATVLEYIVAFFGRAFERHQSEAVVLLYWDLQRKRYRIVVPKQTATVWESSSGIRSPMDVAYEVPLGLPRHYLLVGDIHSHGDMEAYASWTDKLDEVYRDGVHAVAGRIEHEPPQWHVAVAVDGHRFTLEFEHLFQGYRERRRIVPECWMAQLEVETKRPSWTSWSYQPYKSSYRKDWT